VLKGPAAGADNRALALESFQNVLWDMFVVERHDIAARREADHRFLVVVAAEIKPGYDLGGAVMRGCRQHSEPDT